MRHEFNSEKVDPRIFIVGCSRSGTTLLQTLIASHPKVTTFPETHFFWKTVGRRNYISRFITWMGLSTMREMSILSTILNKLELSHLGNNIPKQPIKYQESVEIYLSLLDEIAVNRDNKEVWVEKTPKHIFEIPWILEYVPNAKVIHIVRDGREVVSSIVKRSREHPDQFKRQGIRYALSLWNKTIKISQKFVNEKNNYVLRYEDLVSDTNKVMTGVGDFLGLSYSNVDFKRRDAVYSNAVKSSEPWKYNVTNSINNRNSKFDKIFTEKEKKYINKRIRDNDFYDFE